LRALLREKSMLVAGMKFAVFSGRDGAIGKMRVLGGQG
jgi:hypothetical protein